MIQRIKTKNLPIRSKLTLVFLLSTLIILLVDVLIFTYINNMLGKVDDSYYSNVRLVELENSLDNVRENMTDYLSTKSSDSMSGYYLAEQEYSNLIKLLNDAICDDTGLMLEKSIRSMSENYLKLASDAVDAKRGRNVEEYTRLYEKSENVYEHIYTYIYSLNSMQFQSNTIHYEKLTNLLKMAENVCMIVLVSVGFVAVILISVLTANIIDPLESHLTNAKLKYLQSQISPHFLFNTLNAGAQLAMMEEADRTYTYIQNVAEFFRYNLKRDLSSTTLAEEIALVDNFIYILNVRFANELIYEKDIDEELVSAVVPGMILQPLVENCVNHGLRLVEHEKRICLRVQREGDKICISISDNGVGISQQKIDEILNDRVQSDSEDKDSNGIGVSNVISRLRLFYKRQDVIEITSAGEDCGTEVALYIPYDLDAEIDE